MYRRLGANLFEGQERAVECGTLRKAQVIGGANQLVCRRDLHNQGRGVEIPVLVHYGTCVRVKCLSFQCVLSANKSQEGS